MSDALPYRDRRQAIPLIVAVSDYEGQPSIRVSATQRDELTASQASRLVAEWMEFFASGPSPIKELDFVTRTPKRLFESLASQTQLERLQVKWGDYDDLSVLGGMQQLTELMLQGASSVTSLEPLADLANVRRLVLEGLSRVSDLSPLARMASVVDLDIGGNWMAPKNVHVKSIRFLDNMPQLRELIVHTTIVDDHDYSPLLRLPNIEQVRVMKTRGMRPSFEELKAALPWSG